jgi:hypothetical protein
MPLVCIRSSLKSVLRYKFFILYTCHPDTLYVREKRCEIRGYFAKPQAIREPKKKPFWGTLLQVIHTLCETQLLAAAKKVTLCVITYLARSEDLTPVPLKIEYSGMLNAISTGK